MQTTNATFKKTGIEYIPGTGIKWSELKGLIDEWNLKLVDLPNKAYWQNNDETVVVELPADEDTFGIATLVANMHSVQPDELKVIKIAGGRIIARMWWD